MSIHNPCIKSFLDIDYYKLTMGQFAWKYFPDVKVKYAFTNRTKDVKLAEIIPMTQLMSHLCDIGELRFQENDIKYLENLRVFDPQYLEFLKTVKIPPIKLAVKDSQFVIEVEELWSEAIFAETMILSTVNELYYRNETSISLIESKRRLEEKIKRLKFYYETSSRGLGSTHPIYFSDFGTRRRFSGEWQDYVVSQLIQVSTFLGTSNVHLARKYYVKPIGTFAHELPMILAGLNGETDDSLQKSHRKVLELWYELYGDELSIALTDTFGTDFFFRDFTSITAHAYKGLRQDSGDPFKFAETAIQFYEKQNIDPKTKTIVFSDGLDLDKIVALNEIFSDRIKVVFGWGTTLTCDVSDDIQPLSIVVKAVEANGHGLVKLSDNLNKAIGKPQDVERYKRVFGYINVEKQEIIY